MEKIKLNEAKEMVKTSISSLFTKQDVVEILERLDMESNKNDIEDIFNRIKINFAHGLQCVKDNIVNKSDVTLELQGNEIYVDDIEVDTEVIESILEEVLDDLEGFLEN